MPPETNENNAQIEPVQQKNSSPISIPAAIITAALIIGLAIIFTLRPKTETGTIQQPTNTPPTSVPAEVATMRDSDHVRGDRNAEVIVIEYSDSDCEYCQMFHGVMQQALKDYDGKLAWVYRFYPLTRHPNAYAESIALSCVAELGSNDVFWSYLDKVMNITLDPGATSDKTLTSLAVQSGINTTMFTKCLKNTSIATDLDAQIAEAQSIGARGTPFSVAVNQKTGEQVVIPGAMPLENLKQVIDSLLK
jgi:protein-disulfide isomerase